MLPPTGSWFFLQQLTLRQSFDRSTWSRQSFIDILFLSDYRLCQVDRSIPHLNYPRLSFPSRWRLVVCAIMRNGFISHKVWEKLSITLFRLHLPSPGSWMAWCPLLQGSCQVVASSLLLILSVFLWFHSPYLLPILYDGLQSFAFVSNSLCSFCFSSSLYVWRPLSMVLVEDNMKCRPFTFLCSGSQSCATWSPNHGAIVEWNPCLI